MSSYADLPGYLYQRAAPIAHNKSVQDKVLNRDKAYGVDYQCCADVARKPMLIAQAVMGSEAFFILTVAATIYNYRYNYNKPSSSSTEIKARFSQSIVEFPIAVEEVAKRYTMRQNYMHELGVTNPAKFQFDGVDLRGFVLHLKKHGALQVAGRIHYLWEIRYDNDDGRPWMHISSNESTLALMQFINSIGEATQNLDRALYLRIANGGLLQHGNGFRFS